MNQPARLALQLQMTFAALAHLQSASRHGALFAVTWLMGGLNKQAPDEPFHLLEQTTLAMHEEEFYRYIRLAVEALAEIKQP